MVGYPSGVGFQKVAGLPDISECLALEFVDFFDFVQSELEFDVRIERCPAVMIQPSSFITERLRIRFHFSAVEAGRDYDGTYEFGSFAAGIPQTLLPNRTAVK